VLFTHAAYTTFASFAGSVDIFFVVSGFLITSLILEEDRVRGRVDVGSFYLRRVLRLFPVLYTVLFVTLIVGLLVGDAEFRRKTISDVSSAGLYMYHVVHPVGVEIGRSALPEVRPTIHLWSLSVEEHFYLVALIMVMAVVRFRLAKWLIVVFTAIWLGIGVARLTGHVGWRYMWYQRPDALLIGVVAAVVNAELRTVSERAQRLLRWATVAAIAAMGAVLLLGTGLAPTRWFIPFAPGATGTPGQKFSDRLWWGQFGFTVTSGVTAFAVFALVRCGDWWMSRVLSLPFLRAVGRRSYCIYLVHVPLAVLLVEATKGTLTEAQALMIYLPLLPIVSELTFRYVEQPGLRLKHRFERLNPTSAKPEPEPAPGQPYY